MSRCPKTQTARSAIAYIRVSTKQQVDDGVSLDAQRAKLEAWCAVMGYDLVQTCADEGISAAILILAICEANNRSRGS